MRNLKFLTAALIASSLFIGCSKDDDPQPVNEEEMITTMTVTLQPEGGGTDVILEFRDLDGDGPDEPEITNGNLTAGVTYSGSIVLLNEAEEPAENITEEVEEESLEHQFFFTTGGDLDITISNENLESDAAHILKQYVVKRLGVLSLRAVAVLLSDRRDQIGIGDDKVNKKHVLGARRLADKAALDHAFMMRAYRV